MGAVDYPGVIEAAAQSTLGVLSLVVLVLALLAWGFFRGSGESVKLVVFGAILLAGIGFGIAVLQADRGAPIGEGSEAAMAESAASSDPGPTVEPAPARALSPPDRGLQSTGNWTDALGYTYEIDLDGNGFEFRQLSGGRQVGGGTGSIEGRRVLYRFANTLLGVQGLCEGTVAPDGMAIDSVCSDGATTWNYRIWRQS